MTPLLGDTLDVRLGERLAVHGATLVLPPGQVLGIVGPNGAGKTTLLRALAGLLEPARGRVTWGGRDILDLPALERARLVAYLAQGETWHWPLSVEEVVLLGRHPHRRPFVAPTAEDRAAVARALAATATADFATRRIDTLSGGERRRVLLARALAVEAPFLLADEPVSGLDPALQHQTMTGLRIAAGRGVGVAVVLHDLHLAAHYCDHILVIAAGKVVAMGPPDQALADGILRRVYGLGALRVPVEGGAVPLPWPGMG